MKNNPIHQQNDLAQFWRNVGTLFCFRSVNMVLGQKNNEIDIKKRATGWLLFCLMI